MAVPRSPERADAIPDPILRAIGATAVPERGRGERRKGEAREVHDRRRRRHGDGPAGRGGLLADATDRVTGYWLAPQLLNSES
jgi:hypothetical protein